MRSALLRRHPELSLWSQEDAHEAVEKILDEAVFLAYGKVGLAAQVDDIREGRGMSLDEYFREVYRC